MLRGACGVAVRGSKRAVVAPRRSHTNARPRALHTAVPRAASSPAFAQRPVRSVTLAAAYAVRVVAPTQAPIHPAHTLAGMPSLSPTMTTGNIASWKKKEGDRIKAGEVIAEIETDKAAVAFEYQEDAYLAKILYPKGSSDIPVGVPIAVFVDKAEDVAKFKDFKVPESKKPAAAPAPAAPAAAPAPAAPSPAPAAAAAPATPQGGRVIASPLAKVMARDANVDLRGVSGSGPGGRIIASDVAAVKAQPRAAPAPATAATAPSVAAQVVGDYVDIPNTNIRRIIASRLSQSKQTIPHYYLTIDARVDKLQKLRAELNDKADKKADKQPAFKLSVNDFIIRAAALACKKVPEANSSWTEQAVRRYYNVHVNVAVATDQGLLTPIVRDADHSGLASISNAVRHLAEKAKAGKLTPVDLEIGTFTISNLGMFGIKTFSAVILPPQACILAVGTTEKRLIADTAATKGDELHVTTAEFMNFTLSCDHRVVDGAVGAEWLKAFKELIEDPVKMLL